MARIARVIAPGIPHHVTQRGNRRQQTFFCDDDYRAYLALMAERRGVKSLLLNPPNLSREPWGRGEHSNGQVYRKHI